MSATLTEHWNGSSWSRVSSPSPSSAYAQLNGVAAVSASDVWAVGYGCTHASSSTPCNAPKTLIEHWDGSAWHTTASPNPSASGNYFHGVSAASATNVWAVGLYGENGAKSLVEHWNGTSWSQQQSLSPGSVDNYLNGVTVRSPTGVWAVGDFNTGSAFRTLIEHWNGSSWKQVPSADPSSANQLYGVG